MLLLPIDAKYFYSAIFFQNISILAFSFKIFLFWFFSSKYLYSGIFFQNIYILEFSFKIFIFWYFLSKIISVLVISFKIHFILVISFRRMFIPALCSSYAKPIYVGGLDEWMELKESLLS